MADTPLPNGVRISNREIYDKLGSVERNVQTLVDADLPKRVSSLERWKAGAAAVVAAVVVLMPVVSYLLTKP